MPRKGSPYGYTHQKARERQLAAEPWCAYCAAEGVRKWATVADHSPALALHDPPNSHREGSGCCGYVSSCAKHSWQQGRELQGVATERQRAIAEAGVTPDEAPEPVGFEADHPVWRQATWLDPLRDVPENAVWPRLMTLPHPDAVGTFGPDFEEWCAETYGVKLRWWQRLVAYRLLEHDTERKMLWRVCALSMARQMGKSTLLCALMLWRLIEGPGLFGERQLILHVAKDLATARDTQLNARLWAEARPDEFHVNVSNGKEHIMHRDSYSRWLIKAEWAVKGFSPTAALVDECWDVQVPVVTNHVRPSLISHEQWWLLLTSTAADDEEATTLFPDLRATIGMTLDEPTRELYIEWSAARDADLEDRDAWRMASPHWTVEREIEIAGYVSDALRLGGKYIAGVRAEWFNIWPHTGHDGKGEALVDADAWRRLRDVELEADGSLVLAVEDKFGRGASAAGAVKSADGRILLSGRCFDTRDEAYEWVEKWVRQEPSSIVLVGVLLKNDPAVLDMPAPVASRGTTETRAALSLFRELVAAGRVVHDGSDVEAQIAGARVTPAPSGGLQLVNSDRFDLVRAVAWAVAEVHRSEGLAPAVHGSSL